MFDSQIITVPALCVLGALLLVAVVIERRSGRIPNWLCLAGMLAGFALAASDGRWSEHLVGMMLGLLLGVPIWTMGWAGAGFVKLMIAVGTILGPVAPLATMLVSLGLVVHYVVSRRFTVPAEAASEDEPSTPHLVHGSLIISGGTILGLALLILPLS